MSTAIISLVILLIGIYAVRSYLKKLSSGCCGASSQPSVKKVRVKDRNLSHYPHCTRLKVDGMTCGGCATRVETALNSLDGVWARVSLAEEKADVYMKEAVSEAELKQAVKDAGYTVYRVESIE